MGSPLGISQEWPTPNTGRGGGSWFLEVATRWKSPEGHYTAVGPAASLEVPETLPRSQALSLNWAGGDLGVCFSLLRVLQNKTKTDD